MFNIELNYDDMLLHEEVSENLCNRVNYKCPEVKARIGKIEVTILMDSGSNISVMSEETYRLCKKVKVDMMELPLTGMVLKLANGIPMKQISRFL